jgi:hypothetical protein
MPFYSGRLTHIGIKFPKEKKTARFNSAWKQYPSTVVIAIVQDSFGMHIQCRKECPILK